MGEGYLGHGGKVTHKMVCPVTEDSGQYSEEGEQEGWPVGDEGKEEVIDMDTTMGSQGEV